MKLPATYYLLYTQIEGQEDPYIHLYYSDECCMGAGRQLRALHGKTVFSWRVAVRMPSRPFMALHLAIDRLQ